jgi:hypothetical protein
MPLRTNVAFEEGTVISDKRRRIGKVQCGVPLSSRLCRFGGVALSATVLWLGTFASADALTFTPGDLVISVEGNGAAGPTSASGPFTDNQAAPLSLWEYSVTGTASATFSGLQVLPQTGSGSNSPISGEYGSSSEGTLHLSGDGQYLTIMGYGVNAATFNASPGSFSADSGNAALGQSGSQTGQSYTPVPRVVATIAANGTVNTSTTVYNVFNGNNPRSVFSTNGQDFYISGQGTSGDTTGGVFLTSLGSTSATAITGNDTSSKTANQDTRDVQIYNNTLYVSADSKQGSGSNRSFIGTLGSPPATSLYNSANGATQLPGFGTSKTGKYTISGNGNGFNEGLQINLSPENFFFATPDTLYVADSGSPKNDSANSSVGNGGLQKWSLVSGTWILNYTLVAGLNLVLNTDDSGTTGLYGLIGKVVDGEVELFATNYTIGDLDQTYLFGITDILGYTTAVEAAGEAFTVLATAPADTNFKGVAFAPVSATPLPASWTFMMIGLVGVVLVTRQRRSSGFRLVAA